MFSAYNIWTIAKYEILTLSRSWFLRIFSGLAIVILVFYDLAMFADIFDGFMMREWYGMTSALPNVNLLMLNLVVAIISVFLAADFLKRDKKLDTTESIYIRSITNSDYVLGKALALIIIFTILNLLMLVIALVFNLLIPEFNINWSAYFWYPIVISIPTIVFIVGLSFLTMTLIRNQAITFLLLLGYIAVTLFYLGPKYYGTFDYTGFYIPLVYSDFVGFGDIEKLIYLRGTYLFAGISFIFISVKLFRRLPQSFIMQKVATIFSILFLLTGIFMGYNYYSGFESGEEIRERMISINSEYEQKPFVEIKSNEIYFEHNDEKLESSSKISILNNTSQVINEIILKLNPGLQISNISQEAKSLKFERKSHLVIITPLIALQPNEKTELVIEYSGHINEEAAYLDINSQKRYSPKRFYMYAADNRFAFLNRDMVLLTIENMWYPTSGTSFTPNKQFELNKNFTKFKLTVKTKDNLEAISQGQKSKNEKGEFVFESSTPLPQISLTIGKYNHRSIEVDSVSYNLYHLKSHDYFEGFFNELGDTLKSIIRDAKTSYESTIEMEYPFERLSLVEVPIQYTSFRRAWTTAYEYSQPEITFLPENGVTLSEADFKRMERGQERRKRWNNEVTLPKENQANNLNNFIEGALLDQRGMRSFNFNQDLSEIDEKPYSVFPNYFSYVNYIESDEYPIFNIALENYLKVSEDVSSSGFMRNIYGLTPQEMAIEKMSEKKLAEIITDTTYNNYLNNIIKLKSEYIFTSLGQKIGDKKLKNLIFDILDKTKFSKIPIERFEEFFDGYNIDLHNVLELWYNENSLPGFYITGLNGYKVIDDDRERFQVKLNITNGELTNGIVSIKFDPRRGGRGGRRGPPSGDDETIFETNLFIPGGKTLSFAQVLDQEPGRISINWFIAKNLPLQQNIPFLEFEENKRAVPQNYITFLDEMEEFNNPNIIIVDNESEGFKLQNPETSSKLKQLLGLDETDTTKYSGFRFWSMPDKWLATINDQAYGKYVHSFHFTKAGNGEVSASWEVDIPRAGYYDVYTHIVKPRMRWGRRDNEKQEYLYTIDHDDGEEQISLGIENAEEGWNLLGNFYFSAAQAKVALSNKSDGSLVIADAIKWIEKK